MRSACKIAFIARNQLKIARSSQRLRCNRSIRAYTFNELQLYVCSTMMYKILQYYDVLEVYGRILSMNFKYISIILRCMKIKLYARILLNSYSRLILHLFQNLPLT
jgi:hypothetical protein